MTKKSIFLDMDDAATSKLILGNGALVEVKGKGYIGVQTKKGARCICEVLYVLDLDQNFLGVGQLVENGYSFILEIIVAHFMIKTVIEQ